MNNTPVQREYFFDSIRAWLMLLGIPFHISLIYSSHSWHVNSAEPSWWLTLFNDFIHAFRMQVFFVISGYFSYMLFLRYPLKKWWKVRVERVGIPMLTAIPLLTLPQFSMLQYVNGKARRPAGGASAFGDTVTMGQLTMIFLALGVLYALIRRSLFLIYPPLLSNGLFNFVVMQTLFYLPFFVLGAQTFINPRLKAMFTTPSPWCCAAALLGFIAYRLNQQYGSGDGWMYETESVITMVLGLWMVNVVFSLGHRLLNFQSARVTYFVNASLFIYLVHHPLTLLYGAWITPVIKSNTLGFIGGLVFVVGIALILYEIHLRIPLLRFLFSGKPMNKPAKTPASAS